MHDHCGPRVGPGMEVGSVNGWYSKCLGRKEVGRAELGGWARAAATAALWASCLVLTWQSRYLSSWCEYVCYIEMGAQGGQPEGSLVPLCLEFRCL